MKVVVATVVLACFGMALCVVEGEVPGLTDGQGSRDAMARGECDQSGKDVNNLCHIYGLGSQYAACRHLQFANASLPIISHFFS